MRNIFILIMFLCFLVPAGISPCFSEEAPPPSCSGPEQEEELRKTETKEKPPIVDHFACSDFCPGPEEDYMVKIYEGVEDEEECRELGGRPATYVGWGEFHICIAE